MDDFIRHNPSSVFISCVGSNDPWGGREVVKDGEKDNKGPLIRAWEHVRSANAIIFSTPQPDEKPGDRHSISERTKMCLELLDDEGVDVDPYVESIDPTDYEQLFAFVRPKLLKSLSRLQGIEKIYIGISSGTPQQQAMWMSLVTSGQLEATMLQSIDPEKVTGGKPLVRIVHADFILADILAKTAISHLDNGEFHSAMQNARQAADLALDSSRKSKISMAADVLEILHHVSLSKYKKALKRVNGIKVKLHGIAPETWINSTCESLGKLSYLDSARTGASREGIPALQTRLLDLRSQAEYRLIVKDFIQVVILSFTIFESWLNIRSVDLTGHPLNDWQYWKKNKAQTSEEYMFKNDPECVRLGNKSFKWKQANDVQSSMRLDKAFFFGGDKTSVRQARNNAIHSGHSVSENEARKALAGATIFVESVFDKQVVDSYFIRSSRLKWLRNLIATSIHAPGERL